MSNNNRTLSEFLANKSPYSIELFNYFTQAYDAIGIIEIRPAKTMIGIYNTAQSIAWVTQLGKNFIHIVFPFDKRFDDNFCFTKIAAVPGPARQFNHHFRMLSFDDLNAEVKSFMKMAYFNT